MTTSEQLERETEKTRSEIVGALTELRERMTPGRIVDEAFDFARDGRAGQFVRNLGRQAADNPIPVVLIGAGLAWLMMGGRAAHNGSRVVMSGAAPNAAAAVAEASQRAARTGGQIKDTTAGIMDSASRTAHDWSGRAESAASDLAGRVGAAGSALGQAASSAAGSATDLYGTTSQSARQAAGGLASFLKEEPMVLAGIGIALGAALGAAFPASEAENRLMGETSDAVKEAAAEAAGQQWEKGKAVAEATAEKAWDEAKHEAEAQGLMPGQKPDEDRGAGVTNPEVQPSLVPNAPAGESGERTERSLHPGE